MANPNDFLLNTDYEMDKIVYFYEGNHTVTSSSLIKTVSLDSLGFAPLCFGVWSTTSDFSQPRRMTSYGHGIYNINSGTFVAPAVQLTSCEDQVSGGSNTYYVSLDFQGIANNTKIYFRIYGFEPSGYTGNAPETSSNADSFVLNTDYNYRKLFMKGRVKVSKNSSDPSYYAPAIVNHNLNYVPQIMVWLESVALNSNNQEINQRYIQYWGYGCLSNILTQNQISGVTVDSQKIALYVPVGAQVSENFYLNYRIYYDQAQ